MFHALRFKIYFQKIYRFESYDEQSTSRELYRYSLPNNPSFPRYLKNKNDNHNPFKSLETLSSTTRRFFTNNLHIYQYLVSG